jgi:hypothetical protein
MNAAGDHSQSTKCLSLARPASESFLQECRSNAMLVHIQTRSLETLSIHIHAGYAVPRYWKVATPARRSTFCDNHMQTLHSPNHGKRPQFCSHKPIYPFIRRNHSFIGADGSARSEWLSIERVSYSFQHSACKYVNRPHLSHLTTILRLLPPRPSHCSTQRHAPIHLMVSCLSIMKHRCLHTKRSWFRITGTFLAPQRQTEIVLGGADSAN